MWSCWTNQQTFQFFLLNLVSIVSVIKQLKFAVFSALSRTSTLYYLFHLHIENLTHWSVPYISDWTKSSWSVETFWLHAEAVIFPLLEDLLYLYFTCNSEDLLYLFRRSLYYSCLPNCPGGSLFCSHLLFGLEDLLCFFSVCYLGWRISCEVPVCLPIGLRICFLFLSVYLG
jgi:hypothetical protein